MSAIELDPLAESNGSVLNTYLYLGDYEKFLARLPDVNGSSFFRFYRGFGEYHKREWAQASADFTRAYGEQHTLFTGIGKALADGIDNKAADGIQLLRALETQIQERGVGDPEATYKMAEAYCALGDKVSGLRMMRSSVASGFFPYPYFVKDPLIDDLRSLPEFPSVMNTAEQRYETFKKRFF